VGDAVRAHTRIWGADRTHPELRSYFAASQRHGLGGRLPLLIEGPEAGLDSFVRDLSSELRKMPAVSRVRGPIAASDFSASSAWFVRPATFDLWREWVDAPDSGAG
jgi:hypothetical protein